MPKVRNIYNIRSKKCVIFLSFKKLFRCNPFDYDISEIFFEKSVVGKRKSCTFAPAFPEGEGPEG